MAEDFEILDVENYKGDGEHQFSHQILVMKVMNKCIEAGTMEMRPGYFNEKSDKFGNTMRVYVPDSRKQFIENVRTAEMIMVCDLDKVATDEIKNIKDKIKKEFRVLCILEEKYWDNLNINLKREKWSQGIMQQKGALHTQLEFYQQYFEFEVEMYRNIVAELTKLTERLLFYEVQDFEA